MKRFWYRFWHWCRDLSGIHRATFFLEIVGIVVVAIYRTVAALQWCQMRSATRATKTAADAARKSADAEVATVRAWLAVSDQQFVYIDPAPGKVFSPMFGLKINNVGKTIGRQLKTSEEFVFDDSAQLRHFPQCPTTHKSEIQFIKVGETQWWSEPIKTIGKGQFARVVKRQGNASIYAHGCIEYRDVVIKVGASDGILFPL
jgi:hypothetical protein